MQGLAIATASRPMSHLDPEQHERLIIGHNIGLKMIETNTSNKELALALDVQPSQTSNWRRGRIRPSRAHLIELALFFGEKPEWFHVDRTDLDELPAA